MNKVLVFTLLFLTFTSISAQKALIKTNLLGVLSGDYGLSIEIPINDVNSFEFGGGVVKQTKEDVDGFYIEADYRFYFDTPNRFYVAPLIGFESLEDKNNIKSKVYTTGAIGGYQYLLLNKKKSGLILDLSLGPVIQSVDGGVDEYTPNDSGMFEAFKLKYSASIGFVF